MANLWLFCTKHAVALTFLLMVSWSFQPTQCFAVLPSDLQDLGNGGEIGYPTDYLVNDGEMSNIMKAGDPINGDEAFWFSRSL